MRLGCSLAHFAKEAGICFSKGFSGIRDFKMMTPSARRSTAISRSSHSILRKAGLVSTAAAFPLILRLQVLCGSLSLSPDIHRLSLFQKGLDAFAELFRAAAHPVDPVIVFDQRRTRHILLLRIQRIAAFIAVPSSLVGEGKKATAAPCGSRRRAGWSRRSASR